MEKNPYVKHLGYRCCLLLGLVQSVLSDPASDVTKIIHAKKTLFIDTNGQIWREFFSGSSNERQTNKHTIAKISIIYKQYLFLVTHKVSQEIDKR